MKDRFGSGMDVNVSNYLIPGDDGTISALVILVIWLFLFFINIFIAKRERTRDIK